MLGSGGYWEPLSCSRVGGLGGDKEGLGRCLVGEAIGSLQSCSGTTGSGGQGQGWGMLGSGDIGSLRPAKGWWDWGGIKRE